MTGFDRHVGTSVKGKIEYDLPTYLYHPAEEARIFYTVEEVEAALADGWHNEPFPKKPVLPEELSFLNRDELISYARDSMGMFVPSNIKLETLQAKIAAGLGSGE